MRMTGCARLLAVVVLGVAFCGRSDVVRAEPASQVALAFKSAYADLDQLRRLSRQPRALTDDMMQYIVIVGAEHTKLGAQATLRRMPAYRTDAYRKELMRFRRQVHALLLDCLVLTAPGRRAGVRDGVNIAAAETLGTLAVDLDLDGRRRLARQLVRAIDVHFAKLKPDRVSEDVLVAVFAALAQMGGHEAVEWILDEHMHANERRSAFLFAAHKSLLLYRDVPGALRYRVVKQCLRTWVPIERFAEGGGSGQVPRDGRGMMARRLWSNMRGAVLDVLRLYASDPSARAPRGPVARMPSSLGAFEVWFRRHKDVRKKPWLDPEGA